MTDIISLSDGAVAKIKDILAEENTPGTKLRIFVQGGGCSGFSYGFTLDTEVAEDDTTISKDGVDLLVDPMSYQYLAGAEVDYKDELMGASFVINNPNAQTTCGCGSSFSMADDFQYDNSHDF